MHIRYSSNVQIEWPWWRGSLQLGPRCEGVPCLLCRHQDPAPICHQAATRTTASSAWKSSIRRFVITEKAATRALSWLKAATTAFTFKTLLRHYAKRALTPRSLNVKLGPRRNYHKGRAAIRHYANQHALITFASASQVHIYLQWVNACLA